MNQKKHREKQFESKLTKNDDTFLKRYEMICYDKIRYDIMLYDTKHVTNEAKRQDTILSMPISTVANWSSGVMWNGKKNVGSDISERSFFEFFYISASIFCCVFIRFLFADFMTSSLSFHLLATTVSAEDEALRKVGYKMKRSNFLSLF